jgi:hypothetical protein
MNQKINQILKRKPTTLMFFGHKYKVIFNREKLTKDENGKILSWAESLPAQRLIIMAEDIPDDYMIPVLIHEAIEIVNWHNDLRLSHQTISTIETAFYSILMDNK